MSDHDVTLEALADISRQLEEGAGRLRADDLDPDDAMRLAGECAELASQASRPPLRIVRTLALGTVTLQ